MFDLSGFWALFKLNYFCLLFQNLVCDAKAEFELFHIIFLSSVDYLHCLLFHKLICFS